MRENKYKVVYKTDARMDTGKPGFIVSRPFTIQSLQPVGGETAQFDFSDGGYLGLDDVDWKKELIWLEFTGLKDKNGKEIYEGDVLRRAKDGNNYTFYIVVEFNNGVFFGTTRPGFNHRLTAERWGNCDSDGEGYNEIIGNIYQNPDLIK